ncbi:transposase [Aneurinibacillus aneurinilyticus]|jgi:transposase|uniref:transposase n=1 Tax=Aneurinibacillus aneurinilyticus TaxID=1391 RepID=UPI0023F7E2E7|nr:transposase [Aneurinibacillus aneurinilyticus]MCI1695829.1 transposase [Aneurinibacillus aneurinilyticus]MED0704753.1 transposase [Aneurinibacillus aneurinilyticus]MED0722644.1 transposase [Aneurinibacillus aneurinilyticus]
MYLTQSNQIRGLSEVRIIPRNNGQFFHIQYVYERPSETVELDRDKALSVDIGLNNLASCVDTDGASFLVDGKKLKSINRLYNKEKARLQSVAMKQGMKYTKRIDAITLKRKQKIQRYEIEKKELKQRSVKNEFHR